MKIFIKRSYILIFFICFAVINSYSYGFSTNIDTLGNNSTKAILKKRKKVSAENVIKNYIKVTGGKWKHRLCRKITIEMSGKLDSMNLDITRINKGSRKYVKIMKRDNVVFEKWILNGFKAQRIDRFGNYKLKKEEKKDLIYEATLNKEMKYLKRKIKKKLISRENINGKDAYRLEITLPTGKIAEYYDIRSGYKIQSIKTVRTPQGDINIVRSYSNYKKVKGIMFPHSITTDIGVSKVNLQIIKIDVRKPFTINILNKMENEIFRIEDF